jgi:hypothetical protein
MEILMHKPVQILKVSNAKFFDNEFGKATVVVDAPEGQQHLDIEFEVLPMPCPPHIEHARWQDGSDGAVTFLANHLARINELLIAEIAGFRATV